MEARYSNLYGWNLGIWNSLLFHSFWCKAQIVLGYSSLLLSTLACFACYMSWWSTSPLRGVSIISIGDNSKWLFFWKQVYSKRNLRPLGANSSLSEKTPFQKGLNVQCPVVQSIVSLTSLLRVISLTVLADSIHNILIFFAEKMWVAFALQKLLTFFQQKNSAYLHITWCKF